MEDLKNKLLTVGQFISKNACYIGFVMSVIACAVTIVLTGVHIRIASSIRNTAHTNVADCLWGAVDKLRKNGAGDIIITYDKINVYDKEGRITQVLHSPIPEASKEK